MKSLQDPLHPWDVSPAEARRIQARLRPLVELEDRFAPPRSVAGLDVGFEQGGQVTRAAVALLSFPELRLVDRSLARTRTRFPYVPGLLSFREIPALLEALARLSATPDLVICDGQGYAHPRRFGLACHLGVLTGLPSIGAAKSRLIGRFDMPGNAKGSWSPLRDKEETIGAVLRTRSGVSPLYVSVGHRVSLASARELVLACCPRYRLPETTRWAHRMASVEKD